MNGLVYDIHRFSLHDGPGIRTTIFLKGCPLDCLWCHNPEAKSFEPQLSFNSNLCTLCGNCEKSCPNNVHQIIDGKHIINFDLCRTSEECVENCPAGALSIIGYSESVEEIMETVNKDRKYFENSGGGLTISGGEPMAQFDFTFEILKRAKESGIHTAIETCGQSTEQRFMKVLPYVDLFLFDYKETDPENHKNYTGVSNKQILKNLELILENGASVILRCPLIPGFNDNEKHFRGIAGLQKKFPSIKLIEIMAYHNTGRDKAEKIGLVNPLKDLSSVSESEKKMWINSLTRLGCTNVTFG
ncbi:MAG: glycyl-radical enzyme activating protein [Melioribacteraceae bacterium]|nr:glycyl-radical enzyme activating protein [Melioribacteraceae bacterium]